MFRRYRMTAALVAAAFALGVHIGGARVDAQRSARVLEVRRYTANEGKLNALVARMRDGEMRMFEKHGMKNLLHAVAADAPESQNTYVFVLSHESREAAKKSWDAFRNDPEWKTMREKSEAGGPLVGKVDAMYVNPTDFSAVR